MNLIVVGAVLILLGVLPGSLLIFITRQVRQRPQVSSQDIMVPAHDRVLRIVRPAQDSRYEYQVSGIVTRTPRHNGTYADDGIPDHTFDVYHLYDMATLERYEQGAELPEGKVNCAQQTTVWSTYMQTGPGRDFALVFVNPHPYDLPLYLRLHYYPMPRWLRGVGRATIPGGIVALVGLALLAVGVIQWLR